MDSSTPTKKALPLFFPKVHPPRLRYTESDRIRAFRSQPLDRIEQYLMPEPDDVAVIIPPLMHLAWIVDKERMFTYAFDHGVDCMIHDNKGHRRNYYGACNQALTCFLEDHNLPFDDRLDVVYVCDGDFDPDPAKIRTNFQLAVTIGTNYHGTISKKFAAKIQDFVAPGVRPRWFLDRDEWTWTKSPGLDKLREKAKQQRVLANSVNESGKPVDMNVSS